MHVKVDRRLNVTNKFKYQRRLSSRLPIVMFRGTPCMSVYRHMRKNNNCFGPYVLYSIYTIHNDNNFSSQDYPFRIRVQTEP